MAYWDKVLDNVQSTPGIHRAGLASPLPLLVGNLGMPGGYFYQWTKVSRGYFDALGIPLRRGRDFTSQDREGSPAVAIVNQTMADQYWPGKDPIGQQVERLLDDQSSYGKVEVIGVVTDTQTRGPGVHEDAVLYTPLAQRHFGSYNGPMSFALVVRGEGDAAPVQSTVRAAVDRSDKEVKVSGGITFVDALADRYNDLRVEVEIFVAFAMLAMLLTASALYGLVSYITTARTHELGLRLALGASRPSIVRLILRSGLSLTLVGITIGLGSEFWLMRFLSSFVRGVKPVDVPTSGIVALILFCASLAACYVPAHRASRLDPMVALRHD
jgi:putative ABC transport system permease protein